MEVSNGLCRPDGGAPGTDFPEPCRKSMKAGNGGDVFPCSPWSVIAINLFPVFSAMNQFLSLLQGSPGALPFQGFASLTPGYFLTAPSGLASE